jgi:hypothetical protein
MGAEGAAARNNNAWRQNAGSLQRRKRQWQRLLRRRVGHLVVGGGSCSAADLCGRVAAVASVLFAHAGSRLYDRTLRRWECWLQGSCVMSWCKHKTAGLKCYVLSCLDAVALCLAMARSRTVTKSATTLLACDSVVGGEEQQA